MDKRKARFYIYVDYKAVCNNINRINEIVEGIISNIETLEDLERIETKVNIYVPTSAGTETIKLINKTSSVIPYKLKKSDSYMKMEIAMDAYSTALQKDIIPSVIVVLGAGNSWVSLFNRINNTRNAIGYFCTMSNNISDKHYRDIYNNKFFTCY